MVSVEEQRGMKGALKSFDRQEHMIYDDKGKDAVIRYVDRILDGKGLTTIENPNAYGIDVLTLNSKEEVVAAWEVEVRHGNWKGDVKFPFRDINCIERKDHQWKREKTFTDKIPYTLAKNCKVYYVQLNKECTRLVVIDADKILKYPLKAWSNRKASGEYVRQVPISETLQSKV
jgi:hypothetical protein